jgi:CRP-like cAMP-binding protein
MSVIAQEARIEVAPVAAIPEAVLLDPADLRAPLGNQVLARLPLADFRRLRSHLQPAWLLGGERVETEGPTAVAIFPVQSILSLRTRHADGYAVEFSSVGNEGFYGFSLLGQYPGHGHVTVSAAGLAYALPAEVLRQEYQRQGEFARLMLEQGQAQLAQAAILCGCHRRHALEQQLARWLLASFDRLRGIELIVTQEMIASLLGVRREGVTEAARRLQKEGLIEYRRGHVFLRSREGLAARACECYGAIRAQMQRSFEH